MNDTPNPPTQPRRGQVIRVYQTEYPDPLTIQAGEPLQVSEKVDNWRGNPAWPWVWCTDPRGKSGWVPPRLIETHGQTTLARYDYSAIELPANVGETLTIEHTENGWFWCANQRGQHGWIPIDHVQLEPLAGA